jgi:hypothetical protein
MAWLFVVIVFILVTLIFCITTAAAAPGVMDVTAGLFHVVLPPLVSLFPSQRSAVIVCVIVCSLPYCIYCWLLSLMLLQLAILGLGTATSQLPNPVKSVPFDPVLGPFSVCRLRTGMVRMWGVGRI